VPGLRPCGELSRWPRCGTSSSNVQGTFYIPAQSVQTVFMRRGVRRCRPSIGAASVVRERLETYLPVGQDRVNIVVRHVEASLSSLGLSLLLDETRVATLSFLWWCCSEARLHLPLHPTLAGFPTMPTAISRLVIIITQLTTSLHLHASLHLTITTIISQTLNNTFLLRSFQSRILMKNMKHHERVRSRLSLSSRSRIL
jgi:hypothetical protein